MTAAWSALGPRIDALVAAGREASIVVGAGFGWLVLREQRPARRLVGAVVVLAGIGLIAAG